MDPRSLLSLLDAPPDPSKNVEDFCRSLYGVRNFNRLIAFIETSKMPNSFPASVQYLYISSLYKTGRFTEALVYIKSLNQSLQQNPKILYLKGRCLIKDLDYKSAADTLEKAFRLDPYFIEPLNTLLTHHLLTQENFTLLMTQIKCCEQHKKAISSFASLSWLFSGDEKALLAITPEMLKSDPASSRKIVAFISQCLSQRKPQALFLVAQRLLDTAPDSSIAAFAAGCHFALTGHSDRARHLLWYSIRLSPSFAPAWSAYAITHWFDNDSRAALNIMNIALRAFPEFELLHLWCGRLYLEVNEPSLALAHFKRCQENGYVLNEIGCLLMRQGCLEEAVEVLDRAVASPDSCSAYQINCANAHRKLGGDEDFDTAIGLFCEVEEREPENVQALLGLAFCLHIIGDVETAIEKYKTVLRLEPSNPFAEHMFDEAVAMSAPQEISEYIEDMDDNCDLFESQFNEWLEEADDE